MSQSSFSNKEGHKEKWKEEREGGKRDRIGEDKMEKGMTRFGRWKFDVKADKPKENGPFTFHRGQGNMKC